MQKIKHLPVRNSIVAMAVAGLLIGFAPQLSQAQSVSDLQRAIDSLSEEIDQTQGRADSLRRRGDTLENRLRMLNRQAQQLQGDISRTEDAIKNTRAEIAHKEAELQRTKELIQANVKVLYKQGDPSTLEILFSSDNFTDFISRQEYLGRVKTSLNDAARESIAIKHELEDKEEELELKSIALERQRAILAERQQEQRELVEKTRGEESRYQRLAAQQEKERTRLQEEQAAAMAAAAAARRGGGPDFSGFSAYPWPNANMNYNDYCVYPDGTSGADPWGYCLRQCTSYVAWMLQKDGRTGFAYLGHAASWKQYGQPIAFQNAKRGDVLVWDIGGYGHVMYVEAKNSAGLSISQFNTPFGSGTYSTDFFSWSELNNGVGGAGFALRRF